MDETYVGGKAKNMHAKVRRQRIHGRGAVDKTAVVGIRDRDSGRVAATVVDNTDAATLQGFVTHHAAGGAMVYSDDHKAYRGLPRHQSVKHSVAEYVRGQAHVNGVESFWTALKRGYHGTFHHVSPEHLDRFAEAWAKVFVGDKFGHSTTHWEVGAATAARGWQPVSAAASQHSRHLHRTGDTMTTTRRKRGRPSKRTMPDPIPDTPDNIMRAVLNTPPKAEDEWRYLSPNEVDD